MYESKYGTTCSCCGKYISFICLDKHDYTYKITLAKGGTIYQCSYGCFRKEKVKYEGKEDTKRNNYVGRY